MSEQKYLVISHLSKAYRNQDRRFTVLDDLSLSVSQYEFVSIIGASGCGKSTLLRIISGLDTDYQGTVALAGRKITGAGLERGIVFQEHRLLPWLTVEENMEFALQTGTPAEKAERIAGQLQMVGLTGFETAYPAQLSGGMAQRVAIARALVNRPELLLLDEPFGALDALTRLKLQQEFLKIWEKEKMTIILVTHDIEEAVYLGTRVVVLSSHPGRVKKEILVDIPRPRQRSAAVFQRIRQEIYREFQ
ncbi:MAG: ABC transporter ATP-binding protein [Veillonellales bacterium]